MHDASRTTSPSCAVGFRDRTAVVRATYPSPECRGFSPRQLHLCCGRCGSSFRSATDSLHPSAERALVTALRIWRPLSRDRCLPGLPTPDRRPPRPEGRVGMPTEPGRLARSACYGPRGHRPRRLWLARSRRCRRDGGCRWSNGLVRRIDNPWHPCRAPQYRPARHGHGRRDVATPCRAPNIRRCWAARRGEDVSHQPLQPNSCHEHPGEPTLPSAGLAPCRPPLPGPPLFAGCFAGAGTILPFRTRRRRTTTRAIRPRVAPRLAPLAPAGARHQPAAVRTVARDYFFLRGTPHARLCRPCTRWLTRLLTLPVAPPSLPGLRWPDGLLTEPRAPSTDGTPMPPLSEPEASSTDESRIHAPLLARKGTVRAATSAPGFATRAPLPTRVHSLAAS
jgi:hypothetical protein